MKIENLRNIAIVAHVDHGKTTLVNELLKQGGAFRANQDVSDRVMDSGDLEKERGITILAKNTAVTYNGVKINIVDTPGHADFGGEVERVLKMVDGILLLVDSFEGTMPQTRFVLEKSLELGHKLIVVVNKMDRPDARLDEVGDEVLELLMELDATEDQFNSPVVFASGREGTATLDYNHPGEDLTALFDKIIEHIPCPEGDPEGPLQMLVSSVDYNDYVGRMGAGKITRGKISKGQEIVITNNDEGFVDYKGKVVNLYEFEGLDKKEITESSVGNIITFAGVEKINIGDTICHPSLIEAVKFVHISEPTVEMTFTVNDSPFAGREGKFITSRQLRERLYKELLKDVSLRVSDTDTAESFMVAGRGEMHLSVLIETMRREGFEFQVSTPRVLYKEEDGVKLEPMEKLIVDVPGDKSGVIIEKMGPRKGELIEMSPVGNRMKLEFKIPARGLFGYRSDFLTDTKGEGIMNTIFDGYEPYKGEIVKRQLGSLVAHEMGDSVIYGLHNAQDRGTLFIGPGVAVYPGMVVGSNPRGDDLVINVCKKKQQTNVRASGSDDALRLVPFKNLSLEESLEFIDDDELLEVTPENIRIRKKELDHSKRKKGASK